MMSDLRLLGEQKKRDFDSLYAIDSSDSEGDPGQSASLNVLKGKTLGDPTIPTPARKRHSAVLRSLSSPIAPSRQSSNPRRTSVRQLLDDAEAVKETPLPTLQKSATTTGIESMLTVGDSIVPSSSTIPRALGRRKRDAEIKLVPPDQRVFDNLHFYFFPNDDINPSRRARIIKVLEYGATWQKNWNPAITHLVVDSGMKWESVHNYLIHKGGLPSKGLPFSVVVVNEDYPSECITYRMMINPRQPQYLVNGYSLPPLPIATGNQAPSSTAPPTTTGTSQVSDESLQLKPAGRSVMARPPQTPSRTEETPSLPSANTDTNGNESGNDAATGEEGDELDMAIREAKETDDSAITEHLPTAAWQNKFQCMHKHTGGGEKQGPNARTISILQELADYYTETRDQWRSKSYRSAVAALRKHSTHVATKSEAMALWGIGESIAEKIEEIVVTNRLRKLDYNKLDPRQRILQTFTKIYGVGYAVAEKWVSAGYRTLDDLVKKADLTENQRIGIEHYDHFNSRIPRNEVERHAAIVRTTLKGLDDKYQAFTMGSYRRGAESSGDIDMMITKPGATIAEIRQMVLERLVPILTDSKFLVAVLAETSAADGSKWHGASCLPGAHIWRRIDFLLVPEEELGAALIYFTGNDIFNRSLRLLASKKGMRLNQRGLYKDVMRGAGREKLSEGELVEGRDERAIFKALGVPWRPPQHRIC